MTTMVARTLSRARFLLHSGRSNDERATFASRLCASPRLPARAFEIDRTAAFDCARARFALFGSGTSTLAAMATTTEPAIPPMTYGAMRQRLRAISSRPPTRDWRSPSTGSCTRTSTCTLRSSSSSRKTRSRASGSAPRRTRVRPNRRTRNSPRRRPSPPPPPPPSPPAGTIGAIAPFPGRYSGCVRITTITALSAQTCASTAAHAFAHARRRSRLAQHPLQRVHRRIVRRPSRQRLIRRREHDREVHEQQRERHRGVIVRERARADAVEDRPQIFSRERRLDVERRERAADDEGGREFERERRRATRLRAGHRPRTRAVRCAAREFDPNARDGARAREARSDGGARASGKNAFEWING